MRRWLIAAALVGGFALIGLHTHPYVYGAQAPRHGVAEVNAGPVTAAGRDEAAEQWHKRHLTGRQLRRPVPQPTSSTGATRSHHLRLRIFRLHVGQLVRHPLRPWRWVLPWWLRRG